MMLASVYGAGRVEGKRWGWNDEVDGEEGGFSEVETGG